jgi:hypothetical protein
MNASCPSDVATDASVFDGRYAEFGRTGAAVIVQQPHALDAVLHTLMRGTATGDRTPTVERLNLGV